MLKKMALIFLIWILMIQSTTFQNISKKKRETKAQIPIKILVKTLRYSIQTSKITIFYFSLSSFSLLLEYILDEVCKERFLQLMDSFLKKLVYMEDPSHSSCKLIQWLCYFDPTRYAIPTIEHII